MKHFVTAVRRFFRFLALLPETCANGLRFRVFFILPRWFRMPTKVYVAKKCVSLRIPGAEDINASFIDCFLRNEYGLGQNLAEVRTILDVGANVGFFSLAARAYYPGATIHAYEPNPRILPFLGANTSGLNIQIYPEAVSEKSGYITMIDRGPSDQARTRISDNSKGDICQVSLEKAIERIGGSVDLLKLDCEGAEWEIFKLNDCWDSIRDIRMEFHFFDGETVQQVNETLAAKGFRVIYTGGFNEDGGVVWAARAPGNSPVDLKRSRVR